MKQPTAASIREPSGSNEPEASGSLRERREARSASVCANGEAVSERAEADD